MNAFTGAKNWILFGVMLAAFATFSARAADRRWTGNAFANRWSEPGNWTPAGPPQDGDTLKFGNNASHLSNRNDLTDLRVHAIVFDGTAGAYTLSGNPVLLNAGITAAHGSGYNIVGLDVQFIHGGGTFGVAREGRLEISGQVTLANNGLLAVYTLGTNLTLSGAIVGDGSLEKYGEHELILSGAGANTYSQSTRIFDGTVLLDKAAGVRAISADIVLAGTALGQVTLMDVRSGQYPPVVSMKVGPNATWVLENSTAVSSLTLDDGRIVGPAILELQCNVTNLNNSTVHCPIYLGPQTRVFNVEEDTSLQLLGFVLGPSGGATPPGLRKTGGGKLILGNQNTYSGETVVESGELYADHGEALGTAARATRVGLNGRLILGDYLLDISNPKSIAYAEPIIMEGGELQAIGDAVVTGSVTLAARTRIEGPRFGRLDLRTTVSGPGGFDLRGGTLLLSGTTTNTFAGDVLVQPDVFSWPPVLELGKSLDQPAVPGKVVLQGYGADQATMRHFQYSGVNRVVISDGGFWDLHGYLVAPTSLVFTGAGVVDAGFDGPHPGKLIIGETGPDTGLHLVPRPSAPAEYTAFVWGRTSFSRSTNDLFIPAGLTLALFGDLQALTLRTVGPGVLAMNGNNLELERFQALNGEVVSWHNNSLGLEPRVFDGATAWLMSTFPRGPITLEGRGFQGRNGALATDRGPVILGGGLHLAGSTTLGTLNTNSYLFIDGTIDGVGPVTKEGPGQLAFQGTTANTFTGEMRVNEGVFIPAKSAYLQAVPGDLIVGSGDLARPGAKVLHGDHDQIWNRITVNRDSLLDLNQWDEACGEVTLNDGGRIRTSTGRLYLGEGVNVNVHFNRAGGGSSIDGHLSLGPGAHRFTIGPLPNRTPGELAMGADIAQYASAAGLVKEGPGLLRLFAANSFSGDLVINEGRVLVSHAQAFGTPAGGTFVNGNSVLALQAPLWVAEEPLTLNSTNYAAFESGGGSNIWSGPITLQRNAGIHTAGGDLSFMSFFDCCSGIVSGPGGIIKRGDKALHLTGFWPNEYQGRTIVEQGAIEAWRLVGPAIPGDVIVTGQSSTLRTGHASAPTALVPTASVTVQNGAEWQLNAANAETVRALQGNGRVSIAPDLGTTVALAVANTNFCEFGGALNGFGTLEKRGPAAFVLSGPSPFYGGTVTVQEGTLKVDGRISSAPVTVKAGAQLRGDGAVGDVTAIEQDSTVQIDGSFAEHPERQTGDLEVSHFTLGGGGVLGFDLAGPAPTGGNDRLIAHGPVNLVNPRLSVQFNYPPRDGDVLTLIQNNSPIPINGEFSGLPESNTRKLGDVLVRASYRGGDGNDFTLTVTNLPLTLAGYRLAEGNGNQTVEPDECNRLFLSLRNRRAGTLTVTNAALRAVTPGVTVTVASADYPPVPGNGARENVTPFQFTTSSALSCGQAVELELVLGVTGEGVFAVRVDLPGGDPAACQHPTGGCESCFEVSAQFTASSPRLFRPLNFIGGPSLSFPPKRCPETNVFTDRIAFPYLTHSFTNRTANELWVTAQVRFGCPGVTNTALGAVAYLGTNDLHDPCSSYLGDTGADGTQPFSFRVPSGTNFMVLVSSRATNVTCPNYTLALYGLPCPPPTLHIAKDSTATNAVRLHWSTSAAGFHLQSSTNITGAGGPFVPVVQPPTVVNGRYTVTNSASAGRGFFRLSKP